MKGERRQRAEKVGKLDRREKKKKNGVVNLAGRRTNEGKTSLT